MYSTDGLKPPSHRIKAIHEFLPALTGGSPDETNSLSDAKQVLQLPITTLAYVGDAWYEWQLRRALLREHRGPSGGINQASAFFSSASFQAYLFDSFEKACDGTEANLLRRARNHKSRSTPKHGEIQAYRLATAVEALLGFWVLSDKEERALKLLHNAWADASVAWSESKRMFITREVQDDKKTR